MISIILPSYLGQYLNCASNRENKLRRAVNSVINQTSDNWELIIISDGCEITNSIISNEYLDKYKNIHLIKIEKQPLFSGNVRNIGLDNAKGSYITYLDSDDYFEPTHIENIIKSFGDYDWVYFDDIVECGNFNKCVRKTNINKGGECGTSTIAHKISMNVSWPDGYGHDYNFIIKLKEKSLNFKKISTIGYVVCHIPGGVDS